VIFEAKIYISVELTWSEYIMTQLQGLAGDEAPVRTVERDGHVDHVVDLGVGFTGATAEVVDGIVLVATDEAGHEVPAPDGAARAFMNNGVLTVTTEAEA
jgi:hypothetical protein